MEAINPFKNEQNQHNIEIEREREYQKHQIITGNVTDPNIPDEAILDDRRSQFAELRRWQQNLAPKMKDLFEKLAGIRVSPEGNIVKIPYIKPLMEFNGAYQLVNFIETLDVNVIMSNYTEMRINFALRYGIGYPLIQFIHDNYKDLGIKKNFGQLNYIVNLIINTVEPTYLRALNAGERNLDGKIYKINRIEDGREEKEKKGLFNKS